MSDVTPVDAELAKEVPQINAPSNNKMIIAFPFSAVRISQGDEAVAGLAALVVELAEFVAKTAASPEGDDLADRARVLARQIERSSDA
jgi:hypothetical protein